MDLKSVGKDLRPDSTPVIAQTMPDRGSLFSRIQNQNEAMTSQNVLARSASRTSKNLISKIADKARKIKSSGEFSLLQIV